MARCHIIKISNKYWKLCSRRDSNPCSPAYKTGALTSYATRATLINVASLFY